MRKHSNKKATQKAAQPEWSVGLDLGDRSSRYAIVDGEGELIEEGECVNTPAGLAKVFADMPRARIALETGSQSGWIARELTKLGHEALVANARELRGIWGGVRKNDRRDAEKLARYARLDPALLHPTRVRSPQAQLALSELRVREALVRARTLLVNAARGLAKTHGQRLAKTSTKSFAVRAAADLKPELAACWSPCCPRSPRSANASPPPAGPRSSRRARSGGGALDGSPRRGAVDGVDLCAYARRSQPLPALARGRRLSGADAAPVAVGRQRSAVADQQGRRRALATPVGAVCASHSGTIRLRQCVAALGAAVGLTRRRSGTQTRGDRVGQKAGRRAASALVAFGKLAAVSRRRPREEEEEQSFLLRRKVSRACRRLRSLTGATLTVSSRDRWQRRHHRSNPHCIEPRQKAQ